jgi:hypothetical protein
MGEIEAILRTGRSMRDESVSQPGAAEIRSVEEMLDWHFPASYLEFLAAGGLSEMRINHRVLSPAEVLEARNHVPLGVVPFAENGCGDVYAWKVSSDEEPAVVFLDHENGEVAPAAHSFVDWLRSNRF